MSLYWNFWPIKNLKKKTLTWLPSFTEMKQPHFFQSSNNKSTPFINLVSLKLKNSEDPTVVPHYKVSTWQDEFPPCQLKVYYQHSWAVCCVHELNMASCCEAGAPQLFFSGKKWEVEKWWEKADEILFDHERRCSKILHMIIKNLCAQQANSFFLPDILRLPKIKWVLGERKAASKNIQDWLPSPWHSPRSSAPQQLLLMQGLVSSWRCFHQKTRKDSPVWRWFFKQQRAKFAGQQQLPTPTLFLDPVPALPHMVVHIRCWVEPRPCNSNSMWTSGKNLLEDILKIVPPERFRLTPNPQTLKHGCFHLSILCGYFSFSIFFHIFYSNNQTSMHVTQGKWLQT